ncbi:MAG TPA: hypothetical protein VGB85_06335 [Nannocystis sp.]|jgi:tetratricopeptide (TPR) repeat protein
MIAAPLLPLVLSAFSALAPAEALDPEAKEHFDSGITSYKAKEYAAAIKELRTAYALDPQPVILFAWAQAERLYGRCSRADKLYKRFLKTRPSEQQTEAARQGIDRCKGQPDIASDDVDEQEAAKEAAPAPVAETVEEAPTPEPEPETVKPKRRIDGVGIGMLAGGVVLGAVGTGLLASGQSKAKAADGASSYDEYADDASQVRKLRITGGVLAGVGGALILAGVVKLVMHARQPRHDVSFWSAPTGGGLIVRLRF